MGTEGRCRRIVMGVMREALRSTGAPGVVVAGDGPEANLLIRWLAGEGIPAATPDAEATALAVELLLATGERDASGRRRQPSSPPALAARALAEREGLLLLGTATKTMLLLSPSPPWEPILPLGDIFASEVLDLEGECTVPLILGEVDVASLRAVEDGLQRYLEEGLGIGDALSAVSEPLRGEVVLALQKARKGWHTRPLVPKLRGCTMGIDLDL